MGKSLENNTTLGLPTVNKLVKEPPILPAHLIDMLRKVTGQNTQQHLHNQLIENAIANLGTTKISVSEIAYQLGFEYPESFDKLLKGKNQFIAT